MANGVELSAEDYEKSVFEDGGQLVVDLSGVQEATFEAIPKATYDLKIDEVQFGNSKSSGKPMFTFVLKVDGGEYDGRKLYMHTSLSPKAIRISKATLMRIDPVLFAGQFAPQKIVESGVLLGRSVRAKVGLEEGQNGEDQNRVTILPNNVGAPAAGSSGDGFFNG